LWTNKKKLCAHLWLYPEPFDVFVPEYGRLDFHSFDQLAMKFSKITRYFVVLNTEDTQSGNGRFLAYIPS
jgi:hypothetical protein